MTGSCGSKAKLCAFLQPRNSNTPVKVGKDGSPRTFPKGKMLRNVPCCTAEGTEVRPRASSDSTFDAASEAICVQRGITRSRRTVVTGDVRCDVYGRELPCSETHEGDNSAYERPVYDSWANKRVAKRASPSCAMWTPPLLAFYAASTTTTVVVNFVGRRPNCARMYNTAATTTSSLLCQPRNVSWTTGTLEENESTAICIRGQSVGELTRK